MRALRLLSILLVLPLAGCIIAVDKGGREGLEKRIGKLEMRIQGLEERGHPFGQFRPVPGGGFMVEGQGGGVWLRAEGDEPFHGGAVALPFGGTIRVGKGGEIRVREEGDDDEDEDDEDDDDEDDDDDDEDDDDDG
jgi:hypothetical protein